MPLNIMKKVYFWDTLLRRATLGVASLVLNIVFAFGIFVFHLGRLPDGQSAAVYIDYNALYNLPLGNSFVPKVSKIHTHTGSILYRSEKKS